MTRLVIVDDHPLFRDAAAAALSGVCYRNDICEAGTLEDLENLLKGGADFDLILLDLNLPDVVGLLGLLRLRALRPEIPVAVISGTDDPRMIHLAIECGASGFIPKTQSVETLRSAVQTILDGQIWLPELDETGTEVKSDELNLASRFTQLSAQQLRVLGLLCQGLLNRQMATSLGITEATVKAHVSEILSKVGAHSRTQAVVLAHQLKGG